MLDRPKSTAAMKYRTVINRKIPKPTETDRNQSKLTGKDRYWPKSTKTYRKRPNLTKIELIDRNQLENSGNDRNRQKSIKIVRNRLKKMWKQSKLTKIDWIQLKLRLIDIGRNWPWSTVIDLNWLKLEETTKFDRNRPK